MLRGVLAVASLVFGAAAHNAWALPPDHIEIVTSETIPFTENGQIELRDSVGDVRVEGWDRSDVEITVRRATHQAYPAVRHAAIRNQLDRVRVHGAVTARGRRLLISTQFPPRTPHVRPADLDLQYTIRAPFRTNLVIRHSCGDVQVVNVSGSADITGNSGGITMKLPPGESYQVDAHSRLGGVSSDLSLLARLPEAHRLHLRLDVGDINIRVLAN
jgi:hypothetical protein